jgi:hypothetical protein
MRNHSEIESVGGTLEKDRKEREDAAYQEARIYRGVPLVTGLSINHQKVAGKESCHGMDGCWVERYKVESIPNETKPDLRRECDGFSK